MHLTLIISIAAMLGMLAFGMMIDGNLLIDYQHAYTATALMQNVYDCQSGNVPAGATGIPNQIGTGEPMVMAIQVAVGAVQPNSNETYEFDILESASPTLANPTTIAKYAIAFGSLPTGAMVYLPIPPGQPTLRYLGGQVTVGGTAPAITLGKVFLQPQNMIDSKQIYPKGYTID